MFSSNRGFRQLALLAGLLLSGIVTYRNTQINGSHYHQSHCCQLAPKSQGQQTMFINSLLPLFSAELTAFLEAVFNQYLTTEIQKLLKIREVSFEEVINIFGQEETERNTMLRIQLAEDQIISVLKRLSRLESEIGLLRIHGTSTWIAKQQPCTFDNA